jgi:septation ring formation regulator EzrA
MDNKGILIIILTIIVVLAIFAGAFYIINSNDTEEVKNPVTNDTLNISDVKDDNSSDIKNASLEPSSSTKKHYDDWQKDYDTGLVDEYGSPIYRSVFSTSGGQYDPGIYESYWSENGPINETRIG